MNRISVIIPVFNDEAHIGRSVESVCAQTIASELEIIIVDDRNVGGIPDWGEIYASLSKTGTRHHRHHRKNFFARLMDRCPEARELTFR